MGKPSLTRATKSSTTTMSSTVTKKMNAPMSTTKLRKNKKRNRSKKKKNIKRLFDNLKNQSNDSILNISNCTNSDVDVTVVNTETRKCKHIVNDNETKVNSVETSDTTLILVDDDEENAVTITESTSAVTPKRRCSLPPVICSTPNANDENEALQELNVSNVSRLKADNNMVIDKLNCDLTKEINRDSYFTIDLTTESAGNNFDNTMQNTVIDLDNTAEAQDCVFVSCSNTSLSLSGESDVTVLQNSNRSKKRMKDFANCVAKLNAVDKGELLDIITKKIFNGCSMPKRVNDMIRSKRNTSSQATDTLEDTYIKDVIVGKKLSRNSIGSNIYNPEHDVKNKTGLRMIIIDGSNVAMQHARGKGFSVKGLKICIDYFLNRGHVVKAFVPQFRCKYGKSTEPQLLSSLERRGLVVFTPSREIQGRMIASYDDRYIVQCAAEFDGVIVSGDNYRDLLQENPRWRYVIENRLLQFTWVNDMIMFPRDPLGRNGPTLEQFLRHSPKSNINV